MYRSAMRPAWAEINLAALKHNVEQIRVKLGAEKKIIGVIKADAYGHGALNIADALKDNGINSFAVATIPEAVALRKHFEETSECEEILVLGLVPDMFADVIAEYDLTPVVCDYENAKALAAAGAALGKTVSILIAVDTGMGRIGYVIPDEAVCSDFSCSPASSSQALIKSLEGVAAHNISKPLEETQAHKLPLIHEIIEEIRMISKLSNIRITGIISHMSTADEADKAYAKLQNKKYKAFVRELEKSGIFAPRCEGMSAASECSDMVCHNNDVHKLPPFPCLTLANSAGIMELEDTYFDAVRPGIILYGCYPSDEVDKSLIDLEPVMSVKAVIKHLKEVPSGFSVGYGRKFISERPSKIATLGIGYADGYPRRYSTMVPEAADSLQGPSDVKQAASDVSACSSEVPAKPLPCVIVNGRYAPLAGKICMDQCMIDVTDIPDVKVGDEVIIMGCAPPAYDAGTRKSDSSAISTEDTKTSECSCNSTGMLSVTADDIASSIGTINYEVLCGFALRLPRIYKYSK